MKPWTASCPVGTDLVGAALVAAQLRIASVVAPYRKGGHKGRPYTPCAGPLCPNYPQICNLIC